MSDPIINNLQTHLLSVLSKESSFDTTLVHRAETKLSLDNSILVNDINDTIIKSLLPLLIGILKTPIEGVEYDVIISLLSTILSHKSYTQVVHFLSQQDLIDGLKSDVSHLQVASINVIMKADPPDILSSTPILPVLVELLATPSKASNPDVIHSAHKALITLASLGDLNRRRLFSNDCLAILETKLHNGDSILQGRLMNLITEILQFDKSPNQYIPSELIQFPPDSIDKDDDVLLVVNKIQFYRDIIYHPHPANLLNTIAPQIERIAILYSKLKDDPVMESFLTNEIYTFFGILSSTDLAIFRELDTKYQLTKPLESSNINFNNQSTNMFLSLLSPKYINEFLSDTINKIPIQISTIRVIRNLITNKSTYEKLSTTPNALSNSTQLSELQDLELMVIVLQMSSTPWGLNDLLTWPRIMDSILSKDVQNDTSLSYRKQILENFILNPPQTLGIWNEPIHSKYRELQYGTHPIEAHAAVADESAS